MTRLIHLLLLASFTAIAQPGVNVGTVGTFSNLLSRVPSANQTVHVLGDSIAIDGGGGWWIWDATSTAAAATNVIVKPGYATGRWIALTNRAWFSDAFATSLNVLGIPEGPNMAAAVETAAHLAAAPTNVGALTLLGMTDTGIGGGTLWWDATNALNADLWWGMAFTNSAAATGRFVREYDNFVRPEWFGAVGDFNPSTQTGTDDTEAFRRAIRWMASAQSANARPALQLSARNYRLTDTINIETNTGVALPAHFAILGAQPLNTTITLDHTGPGFFVRGREVVFRDLLITSSTNRQAWPWDSNPTNGTAIITKRDTSSSHSRIGGFNLRVTAQPGHGIVTYEPELHYWQQIDCHTNGGFGFYIAAEAGTATGGGFVNEYAGLRLTSNGWADTHETNKGGLYNLGAYSYFLNLEAYDNYGHAQATIATSASRVCVFINPDLEGQHFRASGITNLLSDLEIYSSNWVHSPSYDFAAAGYETNKWLMLAGTEENDGAWMIKTVQTNWLEIDQTIFGTNMRNESSPTNVAVATSDSNWGMIVNGRAPQIIGGHMSSLVGGIALVRTDGGFISAPVVTASSANWTMPVGIWRARSDYGGAFILLPSEDGTKVHSLYTDVPTGSNVDVVWRDGSLLYGDVPLPLTATFGDATTTTALALNGGFGGQNIVTITDDDGTQYGIKGSSDDFILRLQSQSQDAIKYEWTATSPQLVLGPDDTDYSITDVTIAVADRLAGATNGAGGDLRFEPGSGTGDGNSFARGRIIFRYPQTNTTATAVQSVATIGSIQPGHGALKYGDNPTTRITLPLLADFESTTRATRTTPKMTDVQIAAITTSSALEGADVFSTDRERELVYIQDGDADTTDGWLGKSRFGPARIRVWDVGGNISASSQINLVLAESGPATLTLPDPVAYQGQIHQVKKIGTNVNSVTVDTSFGGVEGGSSLVWTNQGRGFEFLAYGSNWWAVTQVQ